MAKEEKPEGEKAGAKKAKPAAKHIHKITVEHVRDAKGKHKGYVIHHTHHTDAKGTMTEPERPAGVADTAEEAGQHVAEQFGAQEGAGGAEPEEAGAQPPAGGMGGGEPEPGA